MPKDKPAAGATPDTTSSAKPPKLPKPKPSLPTHPTLGKITVFPARRILTMCDANPVADAVAVADGRVVAVGSMKDIQPWLDRWDHEVDRRFRKKFILPGFVDAHVHPSLPAVLSNFPFLAPEDWDLPTGHFPGARTPKAYVARLRELAAKHDDPSMPFVCWGFHPLWHGEQYRPRLDELFPDKPVVLWHRSFHEVVLNGAALKHFGLEESAVRGRPETDWDKGHFWENGATLVLSKLAGWLFQPERYANGIATFFEMAHRAGVTTCLDMGIGIFGDAPGEARLILETAEARRVPVRAILTPTQFDFLTRGQGPQQAFEQAERWASEIKSRRVFLDRHFKLQIDGAIYGGLSQVGFPGYLDGHSGMWMAPPEVFYEYALPFWNAGYQIHAHVNGDLSADLFIDIVRRLQQAKPRLGHRATLEHFAYATEDQVRQMKELGILVSGNPYYHRILGDPMSSDWLGPDRARGLVPFGSLERAGVPFALHSDCPMAPLSPLELASCAASRTTIDGRSLGPEDRTTVLAALRAITIDAAWILRRENEIGSIRPGKKADFAILEDDPTRVGAKRLRDVEVWGTVFEGEIHPVSR